MKVPTVSTLSLKQRIEYSMSLSTIKTYKNQIEYKIDNTIFYATDIIYSNITKINCCVYSGIISLSPLSFAIEMTDAKLGASGLWLETRTGAGGTATPSKFFWPQPMTPWTARQWLALSGALDYFFFSRPFFFFVSFFERIIHFSRPHDVTC